MRLFGGYLSLRILLVQVSDMSIVIGAAGRDRAIDSYSCGKSGDVPGCLIEFDNEV